MDRNYPFLDHLHHPISHLVIGPRMLTSMVAPGNPKLPVIGSGGCAGDRVPTECRSRRQTMKGDHPSKLSRKTCKRRPSLPLNKVWRSR
jgi:hypothetical protein